MTSTKSSQSVSTNAESLQQMRYASMITSKVSNKSFTNLQSFELKNIKLRPASEIMEQYNFIEPLGQGAFGTVIKAERKSDGLIVAVKIIKNTAQSQRELQIHCRLDHPNIVCILEVYSDNNHIFMVQEYCQLSLAQKLKQGPLTGPETEAVGRQLFAALEYLHSGVAAFQGLAVIHRDVKLENIMLQTPICSNDRTSANLLHTEERPCDNIGRGFPKVKLIDFGLAIIDSPRDKITSAAGTSSFMAPEVIMQDYTCKADMWSAGVVVLSLIRGSIPFLAKDQRDLFQEIISFSQRSFENDSRIPSRLKKILVGLLVTDPRKRVSAAKARLFLEEPSSRRLQI